jgi:hypothetical protein
MFMIFLGVWVSRVAYFDQKWYGQTYYNTWWLWLWVICMFAFLFVCCLTINSPSVQSDLRDPLMGDDDYERFREEDEQYPMTPQRYRSQRSTQVEEHDLERGAYSQLPHDEMQQPTNELRTR